MIDPSIHKLDPDTPPTIFNIDLYDRALNGQVKVGYLESLESLPASEA